MCRLKQGTSCMDSRIDNALRDLILPLSEEFTQLEQSIFNEGVREITDLQGAQ